MFHTFEKPRMMVHNSIIVRFCVHSYYPYRMICIYNLYIYTYLMKGICLHNIHILNFLHMNDGMFIQLFRSVNDELVVYESSAGLLVRRQPSLLGLNN